MILVTGADGFIGRRLCRDLALRGHQVLAGVWREGPFPEGCVPFVMGDVAVKTDWDTALIGVEAVVHLAARVHVMRETDPDPLSAFRDVNVEGTRRLAESAARLGVKRFVFMSTIKVHGEKTDKGGKPFSEHDIPRPKDAYSQSKWEAEQVLREVESRSRMQVVIIRTPLVYGPGVQGNVLSMIRWIDRGIPLPLGGVHNQRSLIGLTNLVDVISCCLDHTEAAGGTFLVSDGEDRSTPELIRIIAGVLGRQAILLPVPQWILRLGGHLTGQSDSVSRLCSSLRVDSSRIRDVLGWKPSCRMEKELGEMARTYRGAG